MDDLYNEIGKLVVKFQWLEQQASCLLIELSGGNYDVGLCLTAEMSFSRLVAAIVSTSHVLLSDSALLKEIHALAVELNRCEEERNRIIHSFYFEHDGAVKRGKVSAKQKKGLQRIMYDTSPQEIAGLTLRIEATVKELISVVKKLKARGMVSNAFFRF